MTSEAAVRRRFRIELGLAAVTGFLTVLTMISGEWIEAVFGVDPDHGNGTLEWLIVAAAAAVTVTLVLLARADHRRLPAAT